MTTPPFTGVFFPDKPNRVITDLAIIVIIQIVFWIGILANAHLPGLYMDAVNPDYLAAIALNPGLTNPVWTLPTQWFPILGSLYHGVQNYYVALPVFSVLGPSVVSARAAHGLFGAAIAILFYLIVVRATASRTVGLLGSLVLVTDLAFQASFRTQFYIILSGVVWLFLCILLMSGSPRQHEPAVPNGLPYRRLSLAGMFFGLAFYSYFVFLFFLPALMLIAFQSRTKGRLVGLTWFITGLAVGSLPYFAGYASAALALQGLGPMLAWIRTTTHTLAPLSSDLGYLDAIRITFRHALLALNNGGNELMIFQKTLPVSGAAIKISLVLGLAVLGVARSLRTNPGGHGAILLPFYLILLPLIYLFVASLLGSRLWVHHFVVLVPIAYLIAFIAFGRTKRLEIPILRRAIPVQFIMITVALVLIALNINHQRVFSSHLEATGGVGKFSNAMTLLAETALSDPYETLHVFPDWGFSIPFALITANRVPYAVPDDPQDISRYVADYPNLKISFWHSDDIPRFMAELKESDPNRTNVLEIYYQRDRVPAFFSIRSSAPSTTPIDLQLLGTGK